MKYFFLAISAMLIIALYPAAARTAASVPGEIPQVQPLFPPPEGITPNYSGNINSSVSAEPEQQDGSGPGQENSAMEEPASNQSEEDSRTPTENSAGVPGWVWIGVVAVIAIAAAWRGKVLHGRK